jgi:hypothetical protein
MLRKFRYEAKAVLKLTRAAHAHLMDMSQRHYDMKCKGISSPGIGSFLYGWGAEFRDVSTESDTIEVFARAHELDTLCKIMELPPADPDLRKALQTALEETIAENLRVNGGPPFPTLKIKKGDE